MHPRLRFFYERFSVGETHTATARQSWFELISSLEGVERVAKPDGRVGSACSSVKNVLVILNALLGTHFERIEDLATLSTDERVVRVDSDLHAFTITMKEASARLVISDRHCFVGFLSPYGSFEDVPLPAIATTSFEEALSLFVHKNDLKEREPAEDVATIENATYHLYGNDLVSIEARRKYVEGITRALRAVSQVLKEHLAALGA